MAHLVIQEVLGWKPSQGAYSPSRRGDMLEDEEGQDEEIDTPNWDDRVGSVTNKPWVTGMMVDGTHRGQ